MGPATAFYRNSLACMPVELLGMSHHAETAVTVMCNVNPTVQHQQDILRAQLESSLVRGGLQQANPQQTKSWECHSGLTDRAFCVVVPDRRSPRKLTSKKFGLSLCSAPQRFRRMFSLPKAPIKTWTLTVSSSDSHP